MHTIRDMMLTAVCVRLTVEYNLANVSRTEYFIALQHTFKSWIAPHIKDSGINKDISCSTSLRLHRNTDIIVAVHHLLCKQMIDLTNKSRYGRNWDTRS